MLKAYFIRLYPTTEQEIFLNAQFGAVRFVIIKLFLLYLLNIKDMDLNFTLKKTLSLYSLLLKNQENIAG